MQRAKGDVMVTALRVGTPAPEQPDSSKQPLIWEKENRISSEGKSRPTTLQGLGDTAKELLGRLVQVDGKTRLGGLFRYQPFAEGSLVTQDGFDQVVLYHHLDQVQRYLMQIGFDVPKIIEQHRQGKSSAVVAHANKVEDLNAWYNRQAQDLTFGTAKDKWHLASDADISVHEFGHLLLDHIQPNMGGWYGKEGGAIHEAFGDALAALYFNDPELAEDFPPALGKEAGPTKGLRDAKNQLTLETAGTEVHDRSRPFAGFVWSLKTALADHAGSFKLEDRKAADLMLMLTVGHTFHYSTTKPSSLDFVDAIIATVDAEATTLQTSVNTALLKEAILQEAVKRKFMTAGEADLRRHPQPPPQILTVEQMQAQLASFGSHVTFNIRQGIADRLGHRVEQYTQHYQTQGHGAVELLGHGAIVRYGRDGHSVERLSLADVRPIKAWAVDETVNLDAHSALQKARDHARTRLAAALQRLQTVRLGTNAPRDLAPYIMQARIARTSLATINGLLRTMQRPVSTNPDTPRFVVLPNGTTLNYELKLGMELAYVDAKTGQVQFHKDVLVD